LFASVLIALTVWALLSWVCGRSLGYMIGVLQPDEDSDQSGHQLSV